MIVKPYKGVYPRIAKSALVADNVYIIGDVEIGEHCSIWPGVTIRSDTTPIRIGANVHIEEHSTLHTAAHLEDNVMIGHNCLIEGFVGHDSMVANTAALMPLSRVGAYCTVAAGAMVMDGAVIPDYSFVVGVPGRIHSKIDPDNPDHRMRSAAMYVQGMVDLADEYRRQGIWARD